MAEHICADCGETFRFKSGLTRHGRQQHGLGAECSVDGCEARSVGRNLCKLHWERSRSGRALDAPLGFRSRRDPAERFWAKVNLVADGCWTWTAHLSGGYGAFKMPGRDGKVVRAHRFAYELLVGPIPDGLTLDHLCRNRACVNPQHLEPVTQGENFRRSDALAAVALREQRCERGHPYTAENSYISTDGSRHDCRVCRRLRSARRRSSD